MKIIYKIFCILVFISCDNDSKSNLISESFDRSNDQIEKTNFFNLNVLYISHFEHPEGLDSVFQIVSNLRDKTNSLTELILDEASKEKVVHERLFEFRNYIDSLEFDSELKITFLSPFQYDDELSKKLLVNQILLAENSIQNEIMASFCIADVRMIPDEVVYMSMKHGDDSVQVNLNSFFFKKIERVHVEIQEIGNKQYGKKWSPTFLQLFFPNQLLNENDSLTISIIGEHQSQYFHDTIIIETNSILSDYH